MHGLRTTSTREVMTYEDHGERHAVGLKPPRTRMVAAFREHCRALPSIPAIAGADALPRELRS
jgi:hypothetical protein